MGLALCRPFLWKLKTILGIKKKLSVMKDTMFRVNHVAVKIAWFKKIEIFRAKLGAYSRKDTLTTEDFEMLVIAEK